MNINFRSGILNIDDSARKPSFSAAILICVSSRENIQQLSQW